MTDALTVPCPDCMAPTGTPCHSSYGPGTIHADRTRAATLNAVERGTCGLCGRLLVRGGDPVEVWHPEPDAADACPPLPDPRTEWNGYATALQAGLAPGRPGPEHFIEPVSVLCPECVVGKCINCDGRAMHPVTDDLTTCTCTHGTTP